MWLDFLSKICRLGRKKRWHNLICMTDIRNSKGEEGITAREWEGKQAVYKIYLNCAHELCGIMDGSSWLHIRIRWIGAEGDSWRRRCCWWCMRCGRAPARRTSGLEPRRYSYVIGAWTNDGLGAMACTGPIRVSLFPLIESELLIMYFIKWWVDQFKGLHLLINVWFSSIFLYFSPYCAFCI